MTGFTPGPWKACQSTDADFLGVYPDTGRPEFPIVKLPDYIKPEIAEANARLIAAAPAMLEALRAMTHGLPELLESIGYSDEEDMIGKALSAISLATGESK